MRRRAILALFLTVLVRPLTGRAANGRGRRERRVNGWLLRDDDA